jgi:heat shock protein HtpX
MYDQISSNVRKSWFLILFFFGLIIFIGCVFSYTTDYGYVALPAAVALAIAMTVGSYYYSDRIVLAISKARPATREEQAFLVNSVEGLALAAGIPTPRIYVIDDTAPNAFATGRNPQNAVICVTTGLMQKLDRQELEGVIGHEMSHVRNRDILIMCLAAVLAGTFVLVSDWMLRSLWWGGGRRRRDSGSGGGQAGAILMLIGLLMAVLAPIFAALIQAAISKQREYLADANGALLTRYPEGLASALEKLARDREPLEAANKATAHLYIVNPFKGLGASMANLFNTHPPIEERIRRLRAM